MGLASPEELWPPDEMDVGGPGSDVRADRGGRLFFVIMLFGRVFGGWGPTGWRRYGRHGCGNEYQMLREGCARGEITKEQFDQMTRDLDQHQTQR